MSKLTFGSLFAGIGGFDLGFERAGMECAWQVEIDDYCQRVLAKHWPEVPRFGDVRDVGRHNLEPVDVICGGFPCQPHSLAGERKGAADDRNLWPEFFRVVCEVHPRWVVIENVPGLLSSDNGRFFAGILRDLSAVGYDAEWSVISACSFGAPHTRERLFVIAYAASLRREGDLSEVILQERDNIPPETLDTWHGSSHPFADIQERMGTPGRTQLFDGVPSTLVIRPAIRAYGNAVIPQEAEWLGYLITEADNAHHGHQ